MRQHYLRQGMTLVEMLISLAVLALVFLITSSGIVGALQVQQLQEEATMNQTRLRRVQEVLSQELRGAILGGVSDMPVASGSNSISFALLGGGGGFLVLEHDSGGNLSYGQSNNTNLFVRDPDAARALEGRPALLLNNDNQALLIPKITNVITNNGNSNVKVNHNGCKISVPFTPNTRLFGIEALGYRYEPDEDILYQVMLDGSEVPFAFNLTGFELGYQYESDSSIATLAEPERSAAGVPLSEYEDDGATYELARLQITLATDGGANGVEREYVGFVELGGITNTNQQQIKSLEPCDGTGLPGGGNEGGGEGGNNGGGSGNGDGDDGGSGGDGGNNGGDEGGNNGDNGGDDGGGWGDWWDDGCIFGWCWD